MDQFLKIHVADFLIVSYTFVGDNNKIGIYINISNININNI